METFARFDTVKAPGDVPGKCFTLAALNKSYQPKHKLSAVDFYKTQSFNSIKWEKTYQYDDVIKLIAKNRKLLKLRFKALCQQPENRGLNDNQSYKFLREGTVKMVLKEFLEHHKITIQECYWPVLVNFAQKKDIIDFKMLLSVYRQRCDEIQQPPALQPKN